MKKIISVVSFFLFVLIFLAGCGPSSIVVRERPAPPYYARPAAPGPNYIWIDGEWLRSGRHYNYRQGYWAPPRKRYRQYSAGHWQQRRNGWYWVPGRWN